MSTKLIQYPFTAGEISPQFFGHTDLDQYRYGLADCRNFFVDYRGGISTRPGTEFREYIKSDTLPTKFFPFRYGPNVAGTYGLLFGDSYVRFLNDGSYVVEAAKTITAITAANPGVVTSAAHGFTAGDWVQIAAVGGMTRLNGQKTFQVGTTTANTFELVDPRTGSNYSTVGFTAYTSGGTASRIYTVTSPYPATALGELRARQIRDYVRLTHPDYAIRNLIRASATSWSFSTESHTAQDFGNDTAPTVTVNSATGGTTTGVAEAIYCVTSINVDGEESLPTAILLKTGMGNYLEDADLTATISWTRVQGAKKYRVYRSRVVNHAGGMTKGELMGLVGESYTKNFTDDDCVPDYTQLPPTLATPFAHGAVESIEITNVGSGYGVNDTISVSGGGGSGFRGELVVVGGTIVAVKVIEPGSGYSGATASISTAAGVNAAFTVNLSEASGNNPYVSELYQQRQVYAATDNDPLGVRGSRVGRFSNFSTTDVLIDSDAWEYELESEVVAPIRHLVPTNFGLIALGKEGIWLLTGGADRAITPTNVDALPNPAAGASLTPPILAQGSVLYIEDNCRAARLLAYNTDTEVFGGQNVSILANHLFKSDNQITAWAFAPSPYSVIWGVREDGSLVSFTIEQEHGVLAWASHTTNGLYKDVMVLEEGDTFSVYFVVERYVNSRWTKFIERFASREFDDVEDAFCVDCGLKTTSTAPAAILTPSASSGAGVTFTASAGVFVSGDVGKVIRCGGGLATITGYTSATVVTGTFSRAMTSSLLAESGTVVPIPSGSWTMDATFTSVSGLDHLEGQTVKVLLDGKVLSDKTVASGAIALGATGSRAIVGKGFRAYARTLPHSGGDIPIDDRYAKIIGSAVRVHDTAGLKVGRSLSDLYEMTERISSNYGTAVTLYTQFKHILIGSDWDEGGQTYYVQDFPLPATILGLVAELEVGDDTG